MSLITTAFGSVAMAQDQYREHERTGEKMAVDAVLLRPAGLLATALGSLVFIVSVPFSALGGNTEEAYEEMVKKTCALYVQTTVRGFLIIEFPAAG